MRFQTLLPLAAVLALTACDDLDDLDGLDDSSTTRVRIVHAAPAAPILDAVLNFAVLAGRLVYSEASNYVGVEPNEHTFEFRSSISPTLIDPTPLVRTHLTVLPNQRYTILAVDSFSTFDDANRRAIQRRGDAIEPLTLLDDLTAPTAGNVRLRFVDASPSTRLVDVYITAPGAALPASIPTFSDLTFKTVATYVSLAAGTLRVRVTIAGTTTVLLDVNPFTVTAGQVLTLVMLDAPAGGPPSILRTLIDRP